MILTACQPVNGYFISVGLGIVFIVTLIFTFVSLFRIFLQNDTISSIPIKYK